MPNVSTSITLTAFGNYINVNDHAHFPPLFFAIGRLTAALETLHTSITRHTLKQCFSILFILLLCITIHHKMIQEWALVIVRPLNTFGAVISVAPSNKI